MNCTFSHYIVCIINMTSVNYQLTYFQLWIRLFINYLDLQHKCLDLAMDLDLQHKCLDLAMDCTYKHAIYYKHDIC